MSTIGCFKCSEIQEAGSCPTSGADSSVWQKDTQKYGIAQTYESQAMCSVVVANSGKIYHQALVDQNTCNDPNYIARIAFNVAKIFRDPGSKITCCTTDGCNWSLDSAANNLGLSQLNSSDSSDSTVYYGYLGVALGIILIILLCLVGCFIYYWRKNAEDEEYEEKENIREIQDQFYGHNNYHNNYHNYNRQRSISSFGSSDRNTVESVGRGQAPVSRGSKKISVREATPPEDEAELYNYNFKDKWDLSLAQAGMSSSLEPPAEDNYRGKKKSVSKAPSRTSYSSQDDSAWGSKYDRVDEDNKYQRRRDSRENTTENDNKAWFVEL